MWTIATLLHGIALEYTKSSLVSYTSSGALTASYWSTLGSCRRCISMLQQGTTHFPYKAEHMLTSSTLCLGVHAARHAACFVRSAAAMATSICRANAYTGQLLRGRRLYSALPKASRSMLHNEKHGHPTATAAVPPCGLSAISPA
jgi:hypothetical protein